MVDTVKDLQVQNMSQQEDATRALKKASIWTPGSPWKMLMLWSRKQVHLTDIAFRWNGRTMIPFLMVPATRAPTRTAPRNSQTAAQSTACLRVRDFEETEVAKELAELLTMLAYRSIQSLGSELTNIVRTNVVGIQEG